MSSRKICLRILKNFKTWEKLIPSNSMIKSIVKIKSNHNLIVVQDEIISRIKRKLKDNSSFKMSK